MKKPLYNKRSLHQGFSMVEMVITIVVLGIALAGISSTLFTVVSRSSNPFIQNKSVELAQAYLDEILAMRYQENSPLGGGAVGTCEITTAGTDADGLGNRSDFDDVDDYNGLTETPSFMAGAVPSTYTGFNVTVAVTCIDEAGADVLNSKHILVTITAPADTQLSFSAYRGDF